MMAGVRRWVHEQFNRHAWEDVSHQDDVSLPAADGEPVVADCYRLARCRCGIMRESVAVRVPVVQLAPGVVLGVISVESRDLLSIEDSKLWGRL